MKFPSRFQLYMPLVAACFWSKAAIWAVLYSGLVTNDYDRWPTAVFVPVAVISKLSMLVLLFLLAAWFMRDEYTEGLWRKAATAFAYLIVLMPLPILMTMYRFRLDIAEALRNQEHLVDPDLYNFRHTGSLVHDHAIGGMGFNEFVGINWIVSLSTTFVPFIFGGLILWFHWRASR